MTNPTEHARAAMQLAFDAFAKNEPRPILKHDIIDIQFWPRNYSHVADQYTVRFAHGFRKLLAENEELGEEHNGARDTIAHEAWHVVQAQGRSRFGWWWHYLWNRKRLEAEAAAMAEKYWRAVK